MYLKNDSCNEILKAFIHQLLKFFNEILIEINLHDVGTLEVVWRENLQLQLIGDVIGAALGFVLIINQV